jgi:membrane protein YdbS with pleckstrin-like domain
MVKDKKKKKRTAKPLGLVKVNYLVFALAVATLIIGYYFLSQGPADSTASLTIAPIVLVIGYCVLVPLAIFWRPRARQSETQE